MMLDSTFRLCCVSGSCCSTPRHVLTVTTVIFAPAFLAAGIYLTLKHIVIQFGSQWSLLKPNWYTYIFIACDILSLVMQSAGGALAATADPGENIGDIGTDIMIAGIIWQVVGKPSVVHSRHTRLIAGQCSPSLPFLCWYTASAPTAAATNFPHLPLHSGRTGASSSSAARSWSLTLPSSFDACTEFLSC